MSSAAVRKPLVPASPAPRLLVHWTPWFGSFLENIGDLFLPDPPPLHLTSTPAPFWPDVFVNKRLPAAPFLQSAGAHLATAIIVYIITFVAVFQSRVTPTDHKPADKLTYYDVSEYLPPINGGSAPAPKAQKGDPEYAKQPIVSLPPKPDNRMQTIIDPLHPNVLTQEVKIPNVVVWTPIPAPIPVAAAARGNSLTFPRMTTDVVPPTPETQRNVAELKLPKLPEASVIAPPPAADTLQRKVGDINFGAANTVVNPELVLPVQRASAVGDPAGNARPEGPPSVSIGQGSGAQAMGRLIALGIHPAQPSGPIGLPGGSRSGEFAATPSGHPGAAGTPDKACCGTGPGGTGTGEGGPGSGKGDPRGVYVGPGPYNPGAGVQGNNPGNYAGGAPGGPGTNGNPANLKDLMAKAVAPPNPADIPRERPIGPTGPTAPRDADDINDYTFGPKKYYTMTINMPNLTSASGTWIIRFAELNQTRSGAELTAPVAVQKLDPAYPPELMKQRVEGRVLLYAVIHADGRVGEVRVIQGLDERLDLNAIKAILGWKFRPATKNGAPIDLEAVIQVPFAVKKSSYGF